MAAKASKKQGEKLKEAVKQDWLVRAFSRHWGERRRADLARPKHQPKAKKHRSKK